ncbi:MAG: hypothetical protein KDK33_06775, partial [Leptospiraceae bacterium]|nr:hypothetical protein [Leptospiraceae bacterium]
MISTESSGFKKIMGRAVALMLIAWAGIQAAPQLNLSISYGEFSPDGDGFQDFVWINVNSPSHPLRTKDWILTIRDSDGTRIRQIQADHRKVRPLRGVGNLFLPGKYDVAAPLLPERIYWNGRDDGGKTVRDGLYRLSLQGEWVEGGYFSQDFQVRIDSRKPVVKISATSPTLSRPYAGDGSLQQPTGEITIRQDAPGGAGYTFSGEILSARGELIERRNWTSRLPPSISWNGREPGGSPVEPGNYGYRLIVNDAAGNVVRQELHNLYVTAGRAEVVLDGNRYYMPGANLDLNVRALSGGYSASSYEFQILSGGTVVHSETGSGSIPRKLAFRGGDDLSTGYYSARLIIDRGASRQVTPSFVFFLDREGTKPSISASESTFTPDGDYQNDTVTFSNSSS